VLDLDPVLLGVHPNDFQWARETFTVTLTVAAHSQVAESLDRAAIVI
jgi:hypothetical protein